VTSGASYTGESWYRHGPFACLCHSPSCKLVMQAFPFVVPCALVVPIAECPRNRVGTRTVRRQPEQPKTGVLANHCSTAFALCIQLRQLLAEFYGRFTEGFATGDLQEAQALSEALR
jgi:hypothetical protein